MENERKNLIQYRGKADIHMYTHALGGGGYITESFEDRRICLHLFSFDAIKLEFSLYK